MTRPSTALPAPRWRTVVVDGARMELMEAGSGDPLLFLHGWGLSPRSYARAVTRLCAGGVRVIAPSLPGSGGSQSLPLTSGIDAYADRVAALVDHLRLEKPAFVAGHSFGGGVALALAHRRPDLVRSLTLVNPVGGAPSRDTRRNGLAHHTSWVRWAVGAIAELDPRELPGPRDTATLLRDFLPNALRRPLTSTASAVVALRAHLAPEAEQLIRSGLPVLFVWGDRDRLITPGVLSGITDELGPEVVQGRHGWMLTEPEAFAAVLRDALVVHAMLERRRRGQAVEAPPRGAPLAEIFPEERRRRTRETGARGRRTTTDGTP